MASARSNGSSEVKAPRISSASRPKSGHRRWVTSISAKAAASAPSSRASSSSGRSWVSNGIASWPFASSIIRSSVVPERAAPITNGAGSRASTRRMLDAVAKLLDMTGPAAIEAGGIKRTFGDVQALCGVDLAVPAGTVLGLLGPNGAGKTTLVRILTTLLDPDEGWAKVAGFDVVEQAAELRGHIGLAGQNAAVDENLSGFENLEMVGRLYHRPPAEARERARELLERFDLTDAAERLVKTYSGGMRRRLDLAAALVIRPPVIFLDEPTTGLDPRSRLAMWEVIERRRAEGTTVLLTTQYLDEADRLADQIAVIDHGGVIAEGTSEELKVRFGGERLEVTLLDGGPPDAALSALAELACERPAAEDGVVRVPVTERRGTMARAVRLLDQAGVEFDDITIRSPTLDDVFMTLTGRPPEPEDGEEGAEGDPDRVEAEVAR